MSLRDDVLDKTDIVDLVSKYVQLKKAWKNRIGLCPFHKEKTPSFTVAEDKQIFKCFGCGKWGNAITFHMEIEKTDFIDTLKALAHDAHIDMASYDYNREEISKKQWEREKYKLLNKRVQGFFEDHFPGSRAEEYSLEKRKLTKETIKTFGIGYAPDSHYDLLSALKKKWFNSDDLITAGVARKGNSGDVYAFFRNRLTFPIHDHIGNVVGFGARALAEGQNPKYLNTTETPLYDKSKILFWLNHAKNKLRDREILIVVEWYMDVIALYQYGLPIGIATCGTALTAQHTKLIKRHTENIIFAFDNDEAGFQAAIRGLKVAYVQDLFPKILQFPPEYKDVDERLTKNPELRTKHLTDLASTKKYLQENSIDGFTYILRTLQSRYDILNPVERKKTLNTCFELIAKIEDYSVLTLYIDQLARLLNTDTRWLFHQFKGFLKQQRVGNFQKYEEEKEEEKLQKKHLLAGLWYEDFLWTIPDSATKDLQKHKDIIEKLSSYFPQSLITKLLKQELSDEEQQKFLEAQLRRESKIGNLTNDKKYIEIIRFLQKQLHKLEKIALKSTKISSAEKQEIMEEVRGLKK